MNNHPDPDNSHHPTRPPKATRRWLVMAGLALGLLVLAAGWWGFRQTNAYCCRWEAPRTLKGLIVHSLLSEEQGEVLAHLAGVDPDLAYDIIGALDDPEVKDPAYARVVEAWTDSLQLAFRRVIPARAVEAAARIADGYHQSAALKSLALAAAQLGDTAGARSYFQQAEHGAAGVDDAAARFRAFYGLAFAANRAGDDALAAAFLQQSIKAAAQMSDASNLSYALRDAIGLATSIRDQESLQQAAQATRSIAGSDWQIETLQALAPAAAQIGDTAAVTAFLRQYMEAISRIEAINMRAGAWRDGAVHAAQIGDTALAYGCMREVLQSIRGIKDESFRWYMLGETALAAAQIGDGTSLQQIRQSGASIANAAERARLLRTVALAMARMGDQAGALRSLRQSVNSAAGIENTGDRARALTDAALVAAQLSDTALAVQCLQQSTAAIARMELASLRSQAYAEAALAAAEIRSPQSLRLGLEIATKIEGAYQIFLALDEVSAAAAQTNDAEALRQAVRTAGHMEDPRWQSAAFRTLGVYLMSSGDTLQGQQLLYGALQAAKRVKDPGQQAEALDDLVQTAVHTRDRALLREALPVAQGIKGAEIQSKILRVFAQAATRLGDRPTIEAIAAQLPGLSSLEHRAPVQEALTVAYLHFGANGQACRMVRSMPDKNARWKALACLNLMMAWQEGGRFEAAEVGDNL